ncbi:hypothetical protein BGZ83_010378 [Gryganskiella cystojenkinii]|nr:hypothetical protein BGZ83_010378 [Gryganskiella cystojenkinii]
MAPKQKTSEAGQGGAGGGSSSKGTSGGGNNNNNAGDRQRDNDRSHGNANGHSERAGSSTGGSGNTVNGDKAGGNQDRKDTEKGSSAAGSKRKAESPPITVDFNNMDVATLRRYCRLNKLNPKSKSQEDLATAASKHFEKQIATKEVDSVAYFLFAVKHRHNVLKLTMPLA